MTPSPSIQEGGCTSPRWPRLKLLASVSRRHLVGIRFAVFAITIIVMAGAGYVGFILGASAGVEFSRALLGAESPAALVVGSVVGGGLGFLLPAFVATRFDRGLGGRRNRGSSIE